EEEARSHERHAERRAVMRAEEAAAEGGQEDGAEGERGAGGDEAGAAVALVSRGGQVLARELDLARAVVDEKLDLVAIQGGRLQAQIGRERADRLRVAVHQAGRV